MRPKWGGLCAAPLSGSAPATHRGSFAADLLPGGAVSEHDEQQTGEDTAVGDSGEEQDPGPQQGPGEQQEPSPPQEPGPGGGYTDPRERQAGA
jgi:hypothetical protein